MNAEVNYNFKNPRALSTKQGFLQARSASVGSKYPSTVNLAANSRPNTQQKKKVTKEERDLHHALLQIQSFGNSREESMLMSPTSQTQGHPRLLQMARGKSRKEFTFGAQGSSKTGLFSPTTRGGTAAEFSRAQEGASRSKSPEGNSDFFDGGSQNRQMIQEMQDLQLSNEIAEQVKVNKLLTLNNYSKMLQNVERVKKDLYHDHKILQNVKLVSTLQNNFHEEVFKGQTNHRVLNDFVNATDQVIKALIPRSDAWQIKNHVVKNLNLKIHTAEIVNTAHSTKTRAPHNRKLSDLVTEGSLSPPQTSQGGKRPRTQIESFEDGDTSYEAYVQALTRKANMQQQITQNLIKVKYIKEQDRLKELKKQEAEQTLMKSNGSIDSIEEITQIKKDGSKSPQEFQLQEENMIRDFISERDMFIQRHKQKRRIIFNQQQQLNDESVNNVVEIGQVSLKDFIKKNKINPKIYTFDRSLEEYRPQMNKRIYYLQKSVMLLQTLKIGQARTFLINAVKEFPGDVPLIFNKGLMHFLNQEYKEGSRHFYQLLGKLSQKNLLLINLVLCHLHQGEYEEVLDLQSEIEKKDNFLDFNEKQLRMMGLLAREKLKVEEPQRYEKYMKIQRDKEFTENPNVKTRIFTPQEKKRISIKPEVTVINNSNTQKASPVKINRYLDQEDKEITIVDENKVGGEQASKVSIITPDQNSPSQKEGFSTLVKLHQKNVGQQRTNTERNQGMKVQFSQQFSEAFSSLQQSSDDESSHLKKKKKELTSSGVNIPVPPLLEFGKVYEIDEVAVEEEQNPITKEERNILADVMMLRQDFESENKLIEFIAKVEKRKQGSTKVVLDRRDEFFMKKYKRGVNALLDRNSKYYFKKYLHPEDENEKYTRKVPKLIKPEAKKLQARSGPDLESEEVKLMRLLGLSQEKIDQRMLKYKLQQGLKDAFANQENNQQQSDKPNAEQERNEFPHKTMDFIQFIFREFGLKEVMLPGVENQSILQDIRNIESLNSYLSRLSEFMTTKTTYFADERQRMQAEEENQVKMSNERKKKLKGYDSDNDEGMQTIYEEKKDALDSDHEDGKNMIEVFQNILEVKYIENFGDMNYEDAAFYQFLLQKLNSIDLIQMFLRNAAKKIMSGERLLTFKKELSLGMLQIFREEICKKELNTIKAGDPKYQPHRVNLDMIDRTLRKLRFFKNFAQNIRLRLYEVCRYELIPPGRIVAHQEELESHIFVIISGIASLTVKYLESNESYSGMLIYPGDAVGDANIKDKIVISKGRGETKWYVSSVKECDVLIFERRQFTDVLFKDMMDSLYEKIMCMRNSEFFENLSPYAMVILCSNIELHEYSYGDVILRQNTEPEECFIIISGECKLVLETVIYKPQEESKAKKGANVMKFGQHNYNPSERYGKTSQKQKRTRDEDSSLEKALVNQRKLNEKFSFQHEKLDIPADISLEPFSDRSQSPVYRAPIINNTDLPFSEQKQGTKMIAYRHHLPYDKVVAGKVLCSRALLEKEYIKKFINKKYEIFKEQLQGPNHNRSSSQDSSDQEVNEQYRKKEYEDQLLSFATSNKISPKNSSLNPSFKAITSDHKALHKGASLVNRVSALTFTDPKSPHDHPHTGEPTTHSQELDNMYHALMKSQLTVIADQAVVKVLKLTRKSKKYLSDPLKAMIDNKVYETKFKDYDRPFKNEAEVQKFVEGQRRWQQYKDKVSKNIVQKYVYK